MILRLASSFHGEANNLEHHFLDQFFCDKGTHFYEDLCLFVIVEDPSFLVLDQLSRLRVTSLASILDSLSYRICMTYSSETL